MINNTCFIDEPPSGATKLIRLSESKKIFIRIPNIPLLPESSKDDVQCKISTSDHVAEINSSNINGCEKICVERRTVENKRTHAFQICGKMCNQSSYKSESQIDEEGYSIIG